MKHSFKVYAGIVGFCSLLATSQTLLAEQKYTIPSTPGTTNTGTENTGDSAGNNVGNNVAGHNMVHSQGMAHEKGMLHNQGMNNQQSEKKQTSTTQGDTPTETGQSAFAAIAEIVAILNANPNTDWSKININSLREHLVDMNEVTTKANAKQLVTGNTVTFTVTGKGRTLKAIQTMVIAHSYELDKIDGWKVSASKIPDGAVLTISSNSKTEIVKINALGFFGVMSMGAHHQPHHFGMATGKMVHNH